MSNTYEQYSEQERAIVFATCSELEGILAGISRKNELKVIPANKRYNHLKSLQQR